MRKLFGPKLFIPLEKPCSTCKVVKPLDRFSPDKGNPDGRYYRCKDCCNAYRKIARQVPENKKKEQNYILTKKYGIGVAERDSLLQKQGNVCAICGTDTPKGKYNKWQTDHCHRENRVRGVLCYKCNVAIGQLNDDPRLFLNTVPYLSVGTIS